MCVCGECVGGLRGAQLTHRQVLSSSKVAKGFRVAAHNVHTSIVPWLAPAVGRDDIRPHFKDLHTSIAAPPPPNRHTCS